MIINPHIPLNLFLSLGAIPIVSRRNSSSSCEHELLFFLYSRSFEYRGETERWGWGEGSGFTLKTGFKYQAGALPISIFILESVLQVE